MAADMCDNNSTEKKTNQFTEPKEDGSDEIKKGDAQKLKNELQHLIRKRSRLEEELQVHKSQLEDAQKFPTPDMSQKKFNLNMEESSGILEQWIDKAEMEEGLEMTKGIRKPRAQINLNGMKQNLMGQLKRNSTVDANLITNDNKYLEEETYPAFAGQPRETSLKRSFQGLSPVNEVECQIPKKTSPGGFHLLYDKCPATSCLPVHISPQKFPQQLLLETETTQPQDISILLNENQSGSQLDGPLLKHNTREVHMDFQDLGYETCGKSENEIDREETTSPECEQDEDMCTEVNHMADKTSNYKYWSNTTSMTPSKNKGYWQIDPKSDVSVLQQHVKKLEGQMQTSQKLMQHLQSQSCPSSKSHSLTEDEGWQSDTTGHYSYTFLEQLDKRVCKLESFFCNLRKDVGTQCNLNPVTSSGKYDWLIQAQARELSLLRQKVREGQSVCRILTQHLEEAIKSFEEMLQANDIDYMGQSFREHLCQGNELSKKLNSKLNSKGFSKVDQGTEDKLLANRPKMKTLQKDNLMETFQSTPENRSLSPSSSHGSSESDGLSFMLDDQLSTTDELDVCSELSVTSDCSSYEQDSTQDSDLCWKSAFLHNAPHMDTESRNGLYIFCHAEDFSALKKNILDGKALLHNIQTYMQSALHIPLLEVHGGKVMDCGHINKLFSAIRTLDNILEESNSILSLFKSATHPSNQVNKQQKKQEQVMKIEICTLKNKLKEQELLLQKASDDVKLANLEREGMEKLIMKQLTTTCGALKRARLNLLVKCGNNKLRPLFQLT
ncbi:uncharacterized protein LOC142657459 [Rhinoderma darwinii]|uniref:uncharacterized protein LOC142657459 n=1 Tax=Rhinoderma darwinii TaxID=43563 RepID=UPI003F67DDDF